MFFREDLTLVVALLLVLPAIPGVDAQEIALELVGPGSEGANELIIDGSLVNPLTGEATTLWSQDNGFNRSHILIQNAPGGYSNYSITDPNGHLAFANNTLRTDGSLLFRGVLVTEVSDWTLLGDGVPLFPFYVEATNLPPPGCWEEFEREAADWYWTPANIIHSPNPGKGEGGSSSGNMRFQMIGGTGTRSATSWTTEGWTDNGRTKGSFQKEFWEYGKVKTGCCSLGACGYAPVTTKARIVDEDGGSLITGKDLSGPWDWSDHDDVIYFEQAGVPSVEFEHRYEGYDTDWLHEGVGGDSIKINARQDQLTDMNIDFSVGTGTVTVGFDMFHYYHEGNSSMWGKYTVNDGEPVCLAVDQLYRPYDATKVLRMAFVSVAMESCYENVAILVDSAGNLYYVDGEGTVHFITSPP